MNIATKKIIQGAIVSSLIVIAPIMGNLTMLDSSKIWILMTIGVIASLFQPSYNPFKKSPNSTDKGTARQIIWSIYFSQLFILIEAAYFRYPESVSWNTHSIIALALMIVGLAIRSWGVLTLGEHFTWHISTRKGQKTIKTGPYAFVRHPGYLGAYLTYVNTALFLNAWISLIIALIVLTIAFLRRIHHEENELKLNLGSDYDDYCKHTKKVIPAIW